MYKLSILFLTSTVLAFCPTLKASFSLNEEKYSANISHTYPKIIINSARETNDKETELLHRGVKNFAEGKYADAYDAFVEALSDYESPLAYLYAGALTDNDDLGIKYFTIAMNALDYNEISESTFNEHFQYIKDKGHYNVEG